MDLDDWEDDEHDSDEEFETTVSSSSQITTVTSVSTVSSPSKGATSITSSIATIEVSSDDPVSNAPIPAQATVIQEDKAGDEEVTLESLMDDYANALDNLRSTMDD